MVKILSVARRMSIGNLVTFRMYPQYIEIRMFFFLGG